MASTTIFRDLGLPQPVASSSAIEDDEDINPDIPRRLMRVKILYTFDDENKTNCLARLPGALNIPTVAFDETNQVGIIDLKTCIQAIVGASPELVAKLGQDYTVYAYDYSEYETPLVGQGMLSWILASSSRTPTAPAHQSRTMVTGRVCKNILGLFSNGIKETLEVKLKLVPVPNSLQSEYLDSIEKYRNLSKSMPAGFDPNTWLEFVKSNPHILNRNTRSPSVSGTRESAGGVEPIHQLLTQGSLCSRQEEEYSIGRGPYSAHGSRAGSPTPSVRASNALQQITHDGPSRPASRASVRSEHAKTSHRASFDSNAAPEPDAEDGPARKRAKVTKADWRGRTSFGATAESLRVTASTAASIRGYRPVVANPPAEPANRASSDPPPRAPTPRPSEKQLPNPRARSGASLLRHESSVDRSVRYVSPYVGTTAQSDIAIESADEERNGSTGLSPMDFPSSPPVFPTAESPMPSSPPLPAYSSFPTDSGFMSDVMQEPRDELETSIPSQRVTKAPARRGRKKKEQPPKPWIEVKPGDPELLPSRMPPRPGQTSHIRPSIENVPSSPMLPAAQHRLPTPSIPLASAIPTAPVHVALPPMPHAAPLPPLAPLAPYFPSSSAPSMPTVSSNASIPPASSVAPSQSAALTPSITPSSGTPIAPASSGLPLPTPAQGSGNGQTMSKESLNQSSSSSRLILPAAPRATPTTESVAPQSPLAPPPQDNPILASSAGPEPYTNPVGIMQESSSKSKGLARSQTWSGNPTTQSLAEASGPIAGHYSPPPEKPGLGPRPNRKKIIEDKLEESLKSGEMPPFCNNCGEIKTSTWRRAYVKFVGELPGNLTTSKAFGAITGYEPVLNEDKASILGYRIFKKTLTPADKKAKEFGTLQLCNSCGLWFDKNGGMRPQCKWDGTESKAAEVVEKKKRPRVQKKKVAGSQKATPSNPIPHSDMDETSPESGRKEPAGDQFSDSSRPSSSKRPRASSISAPHKASKVPHQWENATADAALQRAIQSSPARCLLGTQDSPIELDPDPELTPTKPTRRLLFPSPRKEGEVKSLDIKLESAPSLISRTESTAPTPTRTTPSGDDDLPDKENCPPFPDSHDELAHLFEEPPPKETSHMDSILATPKASGTRQALLDVLKTPTPKLHRTALTPKQNQLSTSDTAGLDTPSRNLRSGLLATAPMTPFTAQLHRIFSDDYPSSPCRAFEFELAALSAYVPPEGGEAVEMDFSDFSYHTLNCFSTDIPISSSPSQNLFSVFEDPATSTAGLFDGSSSMIEGEARPTMDKHTPRGVAGKPDSSVDLADIIEEVVGKEGVSQASTKPQAANPATIETTKA